MLLSHACISWPAVAPYFCRMLPPSSFNSLSSKTSSSLPSGRVQMVVCLQPCPLRRGRRGSWRLFIVSPLLLSVPCKIQSVVSSSQLSDPGLLWPPNISLLPFHSAEEVGSHPSLSHRVCARFSPFKASAPGSLLALWRHCSRFLYSPSCWPVRLTRQLLQRHLSVSCAPGASRPGSGLEALDVV